jgi:hypothetical protein
MNEKREQAAREISETREKARNFRVFRLFRVLLVLFETWVKAQPQKPVSSGKLKCLVTLRCVDYTSETRNIFINNLS